MQTLQEVAYDHIIKLIKMKKIDPEKIYSETKMAKQIGVSRTPFRDAIHRLAQDGYLDIIPSKGFRIHQLTLKDVDETFQMRSAIEGYCTLQITKEYQLDASKVLFSRLDELLFQMKRIMKTSHLKEEFWEYDYRFHVEIVHHLNNDLFNRTFESYMYRIERLAMLSLEHEERMENTITEHEDILNVMKSGDVTRIMEVTLRHMENPHDINIDDLNSMNAKKIPDIL